MISLHVPICCRQQSGESVRADVHERSPAAGQSARGDPADGTAGRAAVRDQSASTGVARLRQQNTQQVITGI